MKLRQSDLRHACYRARNDAVTEKNQMYLDLVEPLLNPNQTWDKFGKEWDLLLDGDDIVIIKPETDYDYIHSTLLEAALLTRKGFALDEMSARQRNIIRIVDVLMLEGIMEWGNYNKDWGVEVDLELGNLRTKLYKTQPGQYDVTVEMIEASKIVPESTVYVGEEPVVLEVNEEETVSKEEFERMMKEAKKASASPSAIAASTTQSTKQPVATPSKKAKKRKSD